MAKRRSEANAVRNPKFADLNMTHYPALVDTYVSGSAAFNPNMKGFKNVGDTEKGQLPDYNMAEHVNALTDAVMSIQRILGINPNINSDGGNTTGTVSDRITSIETEGWDEMDERYGGPNFVGENPTHKIMTHRHVGGVNGPPKINLITEVTDKLKKENMNLDNKTGLTGADISVSSAISTKISDSLNDKLSLTNGGIVEGDTAFEGKVSTRFRNEWFSKDSVGATNVEKGNSQDTASGFVMISRGKGFLLRDKAEMEYGRYVIAVRLSLTSNTGGQVPVVELKAKTSTSENKLTIKNTDFDETFNWQTFYMVCDITGANKEPISISLEKLDSLTHVVFDYAVMETVHPAVFSR